MSAIIPAAPSSDKAFHMVRSVQRGGRYIHQIAVLFYQRRSPLLARGLAYSILTGSVPFVFLTIYATQYLLYYVPQLQPGFEFQIDSMLPRPLAAVLMQLVARLDELGDLSTLGIIGVAGLLFITRSVFSSLESALALVMKSPRQHTLWTRQLVHLFLTLFAMLLLFTGSYAHFAARWLFASTGLPSAWLWLGTRLFSTLLLWIGFIVVYRICYHGRMRVMILLCVSLVLAIGWQLLNFAGYHIISLSGRNEVIYGFLAVVIVFLAWSYIFSVMLFVGGIVIGHHSQTHFARQSGDLHVFH